MGCVPSPNWMVARNFFVQRTFLYSHTVFTSKHSIDGMASCVSNGNMTLGIGGGVCSDLNGQVSSTTKMGE